MTCRDRRRFKTLTEPHVELIDSPVERIDESGVFANGEHYDARIGSYPFQSLTWAPAPVLAASASPRGAMAAWTSPPVEVTAVLPPAAIAMPQEGLFVVDFGANLAGVVELVGLGGCASGQVMRSLSVMGGEEGCVLMGVVAVVRSSLCAMERSCNTQALQTRPFQIK